jgi:transcriptional regulator GlxA family with amidase domain
LASLASDLATLNFSTDHPPVRDRLPIWREVLGRRGVRAARLRAIKAAVAVGLGSPAFTVGEVARSQGITARHLHRLFEPEGVSFSEFLLAQRLARAHGMLTDSRLAARTINAIASASGFVDRSHFNRVFRRRYGASPSDVRTGEAIHRGRADALPTRQQGIFRKIPAPAGHQGVTPAFGPVKNSSNHRYVR